MKNSMTLRLTPLAQSLDDDIYEKNIYITL
jgi:hypothetical protein